MENRILFVALCLLATGCGGFSRLVAHYTGSSVDCVEGIKVVQMTSGAFWLPDAAGHPVPCK